jgi:hypothetical protein
MIDNLFSLGDNWESVLAVTPPPFFDEDAGFMFSTDGVGVGDVRINFIGDDVLLPGTYNFTLSVQSNPLNELLYLVLDYLVGVTPAQQVIGLGDELGAYTNAFTLPLNVNTFSVRVARYNGVTYVAPLYFAGVMETNPQGLNGQVLVNGGSSDYDRTLCYDAPVDYDNGRFLDPRARTLSAIRNDIVVRLGYSANTVLPPGMQTLVDSFINDANEQLYERYPVMRLERWWTWQTQVGQKFYDVPIDCTKYLDTRHITGAWLQDDDAWFPLVAGINPLLFNQVYLSLPQYYEVRDVFELWPVPDKATYLFHIKGKIGPALMVADDDLTTVDARPVFLFALANAKAHYQQPDASRYDRQLEIMIGKLTGGSHYSKRYIPNQPPAVGLDLPIRQVPGG